MKQTYLDCLAALGVGGAHPGGLKLSKQLLEKEDLQPEMTVLDLGCGTGQTAAYIARKYKCHVTALDVDPTMLEKCRQRMDEEALSVEIVRGDAENLPFKDRTFDLVLAESVIAFVDMEKAISECRRVLRDEGCLLAIEISKYGILHPEEEKMIMDFYGFTELPTEKRWHEKLYAGGFTQVESEMAKIDFFTPDFENAPDFRISEVIDPACFDMLQEHEYLTKSYQEELSYHIFRCK